MGKILVIPTVSSGNIPQLTMDLLIHTLNAQLVSHLDDQFIYPFAGPLDSSSNSTSPGITTAGDVYQTSDGNLTLVQLRSPTLPGYRQKFVRETIGPFIEKGGFTNVLVLGSSNPALRTEVNDGKFQYFSDSLADQLSGLSLEGNTVQKVPEVLPESGIALDILKSTGNSCAIVMFAYEGDNFGDAEDLADQVAPIIGVNLGKWVRPESWKGIYGKEIPTGMEEGLYS